MRSWMTLTLILLSAGFVTGATAGRGKLQIQVNKEDVDLTNHVLYFRINHPADSAEIKVFSPDGKLLGERTEVYNNAAAGQRLSIVWPELVGSNSDNFRLELKVTDKDEFWIGWEVVRFYLEIPHEDVVFETAKWDIRPSEAHKLDEALKLLVDTIKRYGKWVECELYIAGYTDTVGSTASNRELSRQRANSIARYFANNGLKKIPMHVRGFGEELLKVKTGDNVDEERNRRAQYIISTFPPEIAGPGSWQRIQ